MSASPGLRGREYHWAERGILRAERGEGEGGLGGTPDSGLTTGCAGPVAKHEAVGEGDNEYNGDDEDGERDLPVEQADAGARNAVSSPPHTGSQSHSEWGTEEDAPWMEQLQGLAYKEEEECAALGEAHREQGTRERRVERPPPRAAAA